jgi:hypothetical protein
LENVRNAFRDFRAKRENEYARRQGGGFLILPSDPDDRG